MLRPRRWIFLACALASLGLLLLADSLRAASLVTASVSIGAWGLFARIEPQRLLASPVRGRIMELLRQRPGLGIQDVQTLLGLGWGTTVHHLNRLERAGHVTSRAAGRHRRFFVAGEPVERKVAACLMADELGRRLLLQVHERPTSNQSELAARAGISAPMAHKVLRRLERDGLVRSVRDWRHVRYELAPTGVAVAQEARGTPAAAGAEGLTVPA